MQPVNWAELRERAIDVAPEVRERPLDWEKAICFLLMLIAALVPPLLFPQNPAAPVLPVMGVVATALWALLVGFRKET